MNEMLTVSGQEFDEFAAHYFPRATELLILAKESCSGGMVLGENLRCSIDFAAAVWPQSQEFSDEPGRLEWLSPRTAVPYSKIEQYGIYHIRARRRRPAELPENALPVMGNRWLLTELIADRLTDPRLEQIGLQLQGQARQQTDQPAGSTPEPWYCEAFGSEIALEPDDETISGDYVQLCANHLKNMPARMIGVITEGAKRYCLHFMELCKEAAGEQYDPGEFPPVTPETPAAEFVKYFGVTSMQIETPEDEHIPAYRLSGHADWEPEHGLEIIIRGDRVLYLGGFDGNSPWWDYDPDDEWNFVNGIPQD